MRSSTTVSASSGLGGGEGRGTSLQCGLTQDVGIALAGLRKFDDPLGDYWGKSITAIRKPKGYASRFECDAQDTRRLGVKSFTVQKLSDWHGGTVISLSEGNRPHRPGRH
jgi:hypothetical protein